MPYKAQLQATLGGGGLVLPAPAISDSFNRTASTIDGLADSITDGLANAQYPGGAGFTWKMQQSSVWGIQDNHAKSTTLGTNSRGVATIDTGLLDGVIKAKISSPSAGPGFVLRYVDSDNYIYCYVQSTSAQVSIRKRVAGTDTNTLLNVPVAHVAGATLMVRMQGTSFNVFYNGQFIGAVSIADAALQTSTLHGIFAVSAGSTNVVDDFEFWTLEEYARLQNGFPLLDTLSVFRQNTDNFLVRMNVPGAGNLNLQTEWRLQLVQTALHIDGLRIVDASGASNPLVLTGSGSAWESVYMLGAQGDAQGAFELVGALHGNQSRTAISIELDAVDISAQSAGVYASGRELVVTQVINMIYPVDDTTVAGTVTLTHTFNAAGLHTLVEREFNNDDDWEAYTYYGMMLPGANTTLNTYQVEGFFPAAIVADGNFKQFGTEATWAELSGSGHNYKLRMTLPAGAPSSAGWDDDAIKMGFQDRNDGVIKAYAVAISTTFAEREAVAGLTLTHEAQYSVVRG